MQRIFALLLCIFPCLIWSQKKFWLQTRQVEHINITSPYNSFNDSLAMIKSLEKNIEKWRIEGFVLANIDTITCLRDSCIAVIFKGELFKLGDLRLDSQGMAIVQAANIRTKGLNKALLLERWPIVAREISRYYMDRGYPFFRLSLQDVKVHPPIIKASLDLEKGPFIIIDSLNIIGNVKLSKNFIQRYFQITPGMPYNQSQVEQIQQKAKNLLFAKNSKETQIRFINKKALVDIFIDKSPISRFDFLLGILPNNQSGVERRKWTISGDLKGEFYNRFGQGEYIFGQYKKLKPENQEMILKFSLPYIYNFAFGIDSDFRLFRNGTQHIDLTASGGLQYLFSGANQIKLGYQYKSSRLIEINTSVIESSGKLPQNLDVIYRSGVVRVLLWQTDYYFNPSKGFNLDAKVNVGQKKILPNAIITAIPGFENVYSALQNPSVQMECEIDFQWFIPVKKMGALRFRTLGGIKINSNGVQLNEFYRLGGNATLRGFDEESIWSDRYVVFSTEFRLFLDRNSFLTLPFLDFSLNRILADDKKITDDAMGLGLALNFSTTVGMFNVSFAAGKRLNESFDFGNMKVHFGYLNLF